MKIWCASDDFINDVITLIPKEFKDKAITGNVQMEDFTGIGANSIIMPNVIISEGASIGALSLVKPNSVLKPWTYYAGIPARPIKKRNKKHVMKEIMRFRDQL